MSKWPSVWDWIVMVLMTETLTWMFPYSDQMGKYRKSLLPLQSLAMATARDNKKEKKRFKRISLLKVSQQKGVGKGKHKLIHTTPTHSASDGHKQTT